jgi:uracil DNA glycosylase superfamily protein
MTFAKKILSFYETVDLIVNLPDGIEVMNPFKDKNTFGLCNKFYHKYYNDNSKRHLIVGINPGRFGGGITGIPFTDPIRLQKICGIENEFPKKQELSSVFIYEMIHAFGGLENFYSKFYFSSVSPLGFTKDGKNLNYYDDKSLQNNIKDFVIDCIEKQLKFGLKTDTAFCLGEGKNFTYLSSINDEMKFFDQIVPLPHPRFIMQYKLKKKAEYIQRYLCELGNECCGL